MQASTPTRLPVRLFNAVSRLAARVKPRQPFAEQEEQLIASARKATGLQDLGDPTALEGLRVLLRAYDEEARLTPFGRMMVTQELLKLLRNRLTVQEAWKRNPSLLDAPIRRPLFVLGLPRTGTTALNQLLAQDPQHQVLEYWLAAAPGPRPPRDAWPEDPRHKQAVRDLKLTYWLDPSLRAIHDLTADGPDECRHLLEQCFTDDTFDSNATIPSYTRWYAQRDMHASYQHHRDVLKLIGSTSPQKSWVLKYPAHMSHLQVLFDVYPDACVVQTHRDPTRVLPSLCSLVTGWRGLFETDVDVPALARWQVDMWAERLENTAKVRAAMNPAQFFDLRFDELQKDPLGSIQRLYEHFDFEWSGETEERMRGWRAANPPGKHGGHQYSAKQFGLNLDEVAERYRPYMQRFDLKPESFA